MLVLPAPVGPTSASRSPDATEIAFSSNITGDWDITVSGPEGVEGIGDGVYPSDEGQIKQLLEDARDAIYPRENHTARNFLAFAAGVGVGIGAGMLLAPSSGAELRNNITDKVQEITNRVSSRADAYSTRADTYSTGTEGGGV